MNIFNNKRLIFFLLYFSEGAPIGFIWWALPAFLQKNGFSVTDCATISAVATLPWTFKFILAPLVDIVSIKFLSIKKQLLVFQLFMGLSLLGIPWAVKGQEVSPILAILIFHGIFASLQDICIDALAIKTIPEVELGKINGIMQAGMLVGRSLFGGAGVFIIFKLGLNPFIYLLVSSIWMSLIFLQKTKLNPPPLEVSIGEYFHDFLEMVKRRFFWVLMAITYFASFSYNGISTISSAMLSKLGATPSIHGLTYSFFLPLSMSVGALLAGSLSDKKDSKSVLQWNLLMCIATSIIVGIFYDHFTGIRILILSYALFYFFIGSTTASLYSFLMRNTTKEFAALEFSIFMGIVNLSDSSVSYLTGQLVTSTSYTTTVILIGALSSICFLGIKFSNTKTEGHF